MNKNLSIFKKIKIFKEYKKIVKSCEEELSQKFNLRIDRSYRLYTVLNIPEDFIGEAYSIKKSDIDKISENFNKEFAQEVAKFLEEKGLRELYQIYEIKKVEKYSYLIVFGFSLFKSNKYYDNIYYKVLPISLGSILLSILILLLV